MIGTHIVKVPVKFANPPTSRDAVYQVVGSLSGWNSLEPMTTIGVDDPSLYELRLDVNADSVPAAVTQGEQMYPRFFSGLKQCGPKLVGPISAIPREDYLRQSERK